MNDSKKNLIEAITRPFTEQTEIKIAATGLMDHLIEDDAKELDVITNRLNEVDAKKRKPIWKWALFLLLSLASIIFIVKLYQSSLAIGSVATMMRQLMSLSFSADLSLFSRNKAIMRDLSRQEKIILFGDDRYTSTADRMKGLWDSEPANPAYYLEYARAYCSEHEKLPADFLDIGKKIDPQNAWFTYFAAAVTAKDSLKKKKQTKSAQENREPPSWEIDDPKKFNDAIELLKYARNQSQCRNYHCELTKKRLEILLRPDYFSSLYCTFYLSNLSAPDVIRVIRIGDLFGAKAELISREKQNIQTKEWIDSFDSFIYHVMTMEHGGLVEGIVYSACLTAPAKRLSIAAEEVGLSEDAQKLQKIHKKLDERHKLRKSLPSEVRIEGKLFEERSSLLSGLLVPAGYRQVVNPPPLTLEDLKPGRLTDHELLSIAVSIVLWLGLILLMSSVWLYRFRVSRLISGLSVRVKGLLVTSDWLWIIGIGVILPTIYVLLINRLTPLGCRGLAIMKDQGKFVVAIVPISQYIALGALVVAMPILIARWRFSKRASQLGFNAVNSKIVWIAIIGGFLRVPVIGLKSMTDSFAVIIISYLLLLPLLLWIAAVALKALFSSSNKIIYRSAMSRVLAIPYAFAALCMIGLIFYFYASLQYWFEKDSLMKIDPRFPGMSPYEYKVTVQLREEIREAVGYKP
ncbi:MAG: hypothetical protein HC845_01470 [Akkermansiaceae bacterium]|nr:hypothetical protein [Akkermansiaceae bacterium]